jgi:hypothetical protein
MAIVIKSPLAVQIQEIEGNLPQGPARSAGKTKGWQSSLKDFERCLPQSESRTWEQIALFR